MSAFRTPGLPVAALALAGLAVTAADAPGQDKTQAIIDQVKAVVKDPGRPFTLVVRLQAREDAGDKLETAFARAIPTTRKEKGCVAYVLNRDPKMPGHYLLYEQWRNVAALEKHLKARHITTLLAELPEMLAAAPEVQILVPAGEGGDGRKSPGE